MNNNKKENAERMAQKDENKREYEREQMNDNKQVLSALLEKMPNMLYRLQRVHADIHFWSHVGNFMAIRNKK